MPWISPTSFPLSLAVRFACLNGALVCCVSSIDDEGDDVVEFKDGEDNEDMLLSSSTRAGRVWIGGVVFPPDRSRRIVACVAFVAVVVDAVQGVEPLTKRSGNCPRVKPDTLEVLAHDIVDSPMQSLMTENQEGGNRKKLFVVVCCDTRRK